MCITQSTYSNAGLFHKHPPRHTPGNNALLALWASLSPVKLTRKFYHHRLQRKRWHLGRVCCMPSSFHLGQPHLCFVLRESPLIYFRHRVWVEMTPTSAPGKTLIRLGASAHFRSHHRHHHHHSDWFRSG